MTESGKGLERRLRLLWMVLFVAQSVLLALALMDIAQGDEDRYRHQHARLAVQAVLGMCLALGFLVRRSSLKLLAGLGVVAAIVASIWLWI